MISFCLAAKPASNSNEVCSPCPIWQQQIPHCRVLPSQLLSLSCIRRWLICLHFAGPRCCTDTCWGSLHPSLSHFPQLVLGCMMGTWWKWAGEKEIGIQVLCAAAVCSSRERRCCSSLLEWYLKQQGWKGKCGVPWGLGRGRELQPQSWPPPFPSGVRQKGSEWLLLVPRGMPTAELWQLITLPKWLTPHWNPNSEAALFWTCLLTRGNAKVHPAYPPRCPVTTRILIEVRWCTVPTILSFSGSGRKAMWVGWERTDLSSVSPAPLRQSPAAVRSIWWPNMAWRAAKRCHSFPFPSSSSALS